MDQVALFGVRCLLQETACAEGLLGLVIRFALLEEALFFLGFDDERSHGDGPIVGC